MLKRLKRFVAEKGWGVSLIVVLFFFLILGNAAYAMWEISSNPKFCGICHNIRPYVDSYYTSQHTDNVHYQAGVGCKDCHVVAPQDTLGEIVSYVTGSYQTPLPEAEMPMSECFRCHRDYDVRIEKTSHLERNPHFGHWPNMECTLCHKFHQPSVDYCGRCHPSGHTVQP